MIAATASPALFGTPSLTSMRPSSIRRAPAKSPASANAKAASRRARSASGPSTKSPSRSSAYARARAAFFDGSRRTRSTNRLSSVAASARSDESASSSSAHPSSGRSHETRSSAASLRSIGSALSNNAASTSSRCDLGTCRSARPAAARFERSAITAILHSPTAATHWSPDASITAISGANADSPNSSRASSRTDIASKVLPTLASECAHCLYGLGFSGDVSIQRRATAVTLSGRFKFDQTLNCSSRRKPSLGSDRIVESSTGTIESSRSSSESTRSNPSQAATLTRSFSSTARYVVAASSYSPRRSNVRPSPAVAWAIVAPGSTARSTMAAIAALRTTTVQPPEIVQYKTALFW